jgi:hypothetical protein
MMATDMVSRFVSAGDAEGIAEHWNGTYFAMRGILDTVIRAQRGAARPTVDIARLERVRREMGQQDRGTFKACTRSPGGFSIFDAFSQVREVVAVTSIGHADAGTILRLCAELADAVAEAAIARRAEWESERAAVPAQVVDGGRRERANSEQTERGTR